jgi:tape measure domain-containing protein
VALFALGTGGLGGFLLKLSGEFEQVEVSFETLLGSAEKAKIVLNDLFQFAAKTPFEIRGVLAAARQLLAFGIAPEKLIKNLTILGNVAAGTVGPGQSLQENFAGIARNFGQVRTQMRLLGRDANDFANRGIPIFEEVAKVMGVSVESIRKLGAEGSISFDVVEQAFINLSSEGGRFFNLMDKQSRTFLGIWSNIKDIVVLTAKDIGKTLLPQAKSVQNQFLAFLEINKKIIQQRGKKIFTEIGNGMLFALKIAKDFISTLVELTGIVGGMENAIKLATAALFLMFATSVLSGIGNLALGLIKVAGAFVAIGNAAAIAQIKAFAFPLLVGAALLALGLIIDDIVAAFTGKRNIIVEAFEKNFPNAFRVTRDALQKTKEAFIDFFDLLDLKQKAPGTGGRTRAEVLTETLSQIINAIKNFGFTRIPAGAAPGGGFVGGAAFRFPPANTVNTTTQNAPVSIQNSVTVNAPPGADGDEIGNTVTGILDNWWDSKLFPASRAVTGPERQ